MISLRQRIRPRFINCHPWKHYKYEVERLPVSAQCLFSKKGISIDVLEIELIEEGWLFPDEKLIECLSDNKTLLRKHLSEIVIDSHDTQDNWTEEDFKYFDNQSI